MANGVLFAFISFYFIIFAFQLKTCTLPCAFLGFVVCCVHMIVTLEASDMTNYSVEENFFLAWGLKARKRHKRALFFFVCVSSVSVSLPVTFFCT